MAPQSGRPSSRRTKGAAAISPAGGGAGRYSLILDSLARPSAGRSASRQQAGMAARVTGMRTRSARPAARSAHASRTAGDTAVSTTTTMRAAPVSSMLGSGMIELESIAVSRPALVGSARKYSIAQVRQTSRFDLAHTLWQDRRAMSKRSRSFGAGLALILALLVPSLAVGEILLPPGFVVRAYVTGEGFETPTGSPGRGS